MYPASSLISTVASPSPADTKIRMPPLVGGIYSLGLQVNLAVRHGPFYELAGSKLDKNKLLRSIC